jgi:hypothetical protein
MEFPVVTAAKKALNAGEVNLILPYVPQEAEAELIKAFHKVLPLHQQADNAKEVADLYFFETAVRLHRAGESAPFTGLKPAGLDVGPIIPVAEEAIESNSPDELEQLLIDIIRAEFRQRFDHMLHLKHHARESLSATRDYVEAMLGLQVYSHQLYLTAKSEAHETAHEHEH